MKPSKNLIYCPACGYQKILFHTQKEAERFISFNRGEILQETGRGPIRSYHCEACCGYHVTSNPSHDTGASYDARVRQLMESIMPIAPKPVEEEGALDADQCRSVADGAKKKMQRGDIDEAQTDLEEMLERADGNAHHVIDNYARSLLGLIDRFRAILDNGRALTAAAHIKPRGWMDELFRDMAAYHLKAMKMEMLFEQLEAAMLEGDMERFSRESSYLKRLFHFREGPGDKDLQARCYYRLQGLIRKAGIQAADCPEDRKDLLVAFAIQLAAKQLKTARVNVGKSRKRDIRRRLQVVEDILLPLGDSREKEDLMLSIARFREELSCQAQSIQQK